MESWFNAIAQNLIASVLYTLLLVAAALCLAWLRRRRLNRFFGTSETKRFAIHVSHLRVRQNGAIGLVGLPLSFGGSAIPLLEATVAKEIADLFSLNIPGTSLLPAILNKMLLFDVEVTSSASPLTVSQVDRTCSFLAVGGAAFNAASTLVNQTFWPNHGFINNGTALQLPNVPPTTGHQNPHLSFLVRFRYNDVWWFYAAGLTELSTAAAVHYLASHWSDLLTEFGDNNFFLFLEVATGDHRHPTIRARQQV